MSGEQGRAPAPRECGRDFHAVDPAMQKDGSPTVFNFKKWHSKLGELDPNTRTGLSSLNSTAIEKDARPLRAFHVWKFVTCRNFCSMCY